MSAGPRSRFVAVALAVPLVFALAACSDGDKNKAKAAAGATCPANITQTASTPLPSDVPSPGGTVYDYNTQGQTKFWFAAISGTPDQLASLRDSYNSALSGKGYKIGHQDQEEGAEAESQFTGPHGGTTQFIPLCSGKVRLRIELTS
jgi:hypothetical protein